MFVSLFRAYIFFPPATVVLFLLPARCTQKIAKSLMMRPCQGVLPLCIGAPGGPTCPSRPRLRHMGHSSSLESDEALAQVLTSSCAKYQRRSTARTNPTRLALIISKTSHTLPVAQAGRYHHLSTTCMPKKKKSESEGASSLQNRLEGNAQARTSEGGNAFPAAIFCGVSSAARHPQANSLGVRLCYSAMKVRTRILVAMSL